MEEYIFQHLKNRERVCDNNCEPSKSLAETLTDAPAFKYVDIFEGIGGPCDNSIMSIHRLLL